MAGGAEEPAFRDCLRNVLVPGGQPIGQRGTSAKIRELSGGETEARAMFEKLAGEATVRTHPGVPGGILAELPGGGHIGYRPKSSGRGGTGGPVIDVNLRWVPEVSKLHYR
jgi:hypothetical protein